MSEPEVEAVAASPPAQESSPVADWSKRVLGEINKVFIGQEGLVRGVLVALLADGHVLIESVPGLGKTLLVRAMGEVLGCGFNRIQFTPDLMPSDVTGSPIYDERIHDFRFRPGPVFTQLLLADEINRAPAKTHSALLEIMQETRVTIDGVNYPIEPPFLVLATQNPIESEGTYNLPEAQLDRFLFKLIVDYPAEREEVEILRLHTRDVAAGSGPWRAAPGSDQPGRGPGDAAPLRGGPGGRSCSRLHRRAGPCNAASGLRSRWGFRRGPAWRSCAGQGPWRLSRGGSTWFPTMSRRLSCPRCGTA